MTVTLDAVKPFAELSRADVAYAGGKGANLGELTAAGLPVPPGFVVGAPAYAEFCEAGGLRQRIMERLKDLDVDDTEALSAAAADVRAMVESEPIPAGVEERSGPRTRTSGARKSPRWQFAHRRPPRTPRRRRSRG